jgi:hypothetical protein
MAAKKSRKAPQAGLTPTIEQIICWCGAHRVELERDTRSVRGIAYSEEGDLLTKASKALFRDRIPTMEEDLPLAIEVCDMIAVDLCVIKPSIACLINSTGSV